MKVFKHHISDNIFFLLYNLGSIKPKKLTSIVSLLSLTLWGFMPCQVCLFSFPFFVFGLCSFLLCGRFFFCGDI